jgi:epoxide hydrolase-like predicted phosphatase
MLPAEPPGEAAGRPTGLLLDIGGVVHSTGVHLVGRLAAREPAMRPVIEEIGGIASDRDELWQRMLRRQVSEREYWAQRAAQFGDAVGESWDTRAMMDRFYQLPTHEWLCTATVGLMADAKAAGLRLGALTNDMTAFHGPEWVAQQEHLKLFDVIVDASLTGVMKPDPRAFRSGAEALGLPPEQIVFLDDMPWNVEGARQAGMTAVRVPWDDPGPAIDTARKLLGLLGNQEGCWGLGRSRHATRPHRHHGRPPAGEDPRAAQPGRRAGRGDPGHADRAGPHLHHAVPAGRLGHRRRPGRCGPRRRGSGPPRGRRRTRDLVTGSENTVVVGATGAIGQAVVRRLVRRGLPVLAVARSQDDLDKLAAAHELVTPCPADIGRNDAIQAIGSALDGLGGADGTVRMAVFAAGLPVRGSADGIDPDALAAGSNIKAGGLLRLLHAVRGRLVRGSRFVTFAGSLGLEPRAHEAGPGAVNAAVFNLMRQVSLLYGPRGVTTHTLSPGPADTPRLRRIVAAVAAERGVAEADVWQEYVAQNSLGRLPTADELAWAVELLLDPEADLLHGSVLYLDAGGHRGIH